MRLKLEVLWGSRLLEKGPNFKGKVMMQLELECGLFERFYGTYLVASSTVPETW